MKIDLKKLKEQGIKPLLYPDHKIPTTRREFMAAGLAGVTSYALAPSALSMLVSKSAMALDCSAAAGQTTGVKPPAFLSFDLVGGGNIAGSNVMVGKQGGQEDFLPSYTTLGLPDAMAKNVNRELGLVFHSDSAMLRGIQSVTTPATRANIEGAVFCTVSGDDQATNPHNPSYWINAAGAKGELANLLGTRAGDSGGNSRVPAASLNPAARPVTINRPEDALSLVKLGKLADLLTPGKAQKVLKAVENMSASQLQRFSAKDVPDQIKDLVQCGYIKSTDMITKFTPEAVSAATDPMVTQAFNNLADTEQKRVASMSKLLLDGYAGVATVELPGFDYHSGNRADGETRSFQAGVLIGRALQLASLKQKDLVIYVFSDGSVTSNGQVDGSTGGRGKGVWTADNGVRASTYMLMYRAAGKPKLRDSNRRQIGSFNDSGAVNTTAMKTSSNVEVLVKAVVANYLAMQGREGDLAKVVGDNPFGTDLEQYLIFDKQG